MPVSINFLVVKGCIIDPDNPNDPSEPRSSHWNCLDCEQPFHYPAFVYTLTVQKDSEKLGSSDVMKSPICSLCVAKSLLTAEAVLLELYQNQK